MKDGDAVADAVLLVELVGEFVEGDVVAVVDIDGAAFGGVPSEDDGAGGPGFAEAEGGLVGVVVGRAGRVGEGGGVDDNVVEARVAFVFAANGEEACLAGYGDADLVGDLDAALSFEGDFCEEELYVGFESLAEACGEFGYEGDVLEQDGIPGFREVGGDDGLLLGSIASGEEILPAEEQGGNAEENEEEDEG